MLQQVRSRLAAIAAELSELPVGARLGVAVMLIGLGLDLVAHGFVTGGAATGAILAGRHTAHLVVLVGMLITLGGIVIDGSRGTGRQSRPEGSTSNAVR